MSFPEWLSEGAAFAGWEGMLSGAPLPWASKGRARTLAQLALGFPSPPGSCKPRATGAEFASRYTTPWESGAGPQGVHPAAQRALLSSCVCSGRLILGAKPMTCGWPGSLGDRC